MTSTITWRVAIVGAGPRATYTLERLSASIYRIPDEARLEIHVFDQSGYFGAGTIHAWDQPECSLMNRTADQVGLGADSSVRGVRDVRGSACRLGLEYWLRSTGELPEVSAERYWPSRAAHGRALKAAFELFTAELRRSGKSDVHTHEEEVINISEGVSDALVVLSTKGSLDVDAVLLVTGHDAHDPSLVPHQSALIEASKTAATRYVPVPYPLANTTSAVEPSSTVGLRGTGLVALDLITQLTLGRGGIYKEDKGGRLRYYASGREPARIIAFSSSGLFPYSRPAKLSQTNPFVRDNQGRFITNPNMSRLREAYGVGARKQIDFARHLLPLIVLEMAYTFHAIRDGTDSAEIAGTLIYSDCESFLGGAKVYREDTLAKRFVEAGGWERPFDWEEVRDPLARVSDVTVDKTYLADMIEHDALESALDYVNSPIKAATNGVWRDLRSAIVSAVEYGGLTDVSTHQFVNTFVPLHNRLSNGAAPEVMLRIAALVRAGLVVVYRTRRIETSQHGRFRVISNDGGVPLDHFFEAYLPPFSVDTSLRPLYRNLINGGLVRRARDGLAVSFHNHVMRADGSEDTRITILGPPLEATRPFQISAMRPGVNHEVIREIAAWSEDTLTAAARAAKTIKRYVVERG
ncbi:hypothetical protein C5C66_05715 [Rathayibacter toxicus]|uniref:FAD/NAD(P)-binding protein n=2 Tax=Rathayibacter toxicus TaxID=145458 RepID=UPI0009E19BE4|nr:FAD/NAD(P)-binding protein [Rathayibacter toxicus]PPG21708.1 hypothetical protein C5D15_05700 [Rathayibacter toxicus]PPG46670.1 hypothetical protein C5D16_05675 [Rathayibacter toxicus]PPH63552.1 hypothetical protein C5D13_05770 [Rathayibacter toxicus]PPH67896.1 hypothetical protein C5D01_05740 [Rathayibacter toxicus]PPH72699.1 hypothetical protein C5D24_05630 [Rathayibacter toxicus]